MLPPEKNRNFTKISVMLSLSIVGALSLSFGGLSAEPNRRALGKALSGLTYCYDGIKQLPPDVKTWNRMSDPSRGFARTSAKINKYLGQAVEMDPSVKTYDGVWKKGITYRQAFKTCQEKYFDRLKFFMESAPKPESVRGIRFALMDCQRVLKDMKGVKSTNSKSYNMRILEKLNVYYEKKEDLFKKDPKLKTFDKRLGRAGTFQEVIKKCDRARAEIIEYESPGKIIVSNKSISSLEGASSGSLTGNKPLYVFTEIRRPRRVFVDEPGQEKLYLSFKISKAGESKVLKEFNVAFKKKQGKYKKQDQGASFMATLVPARAENKYIDLWEFAFDLGSLPAAKYDIKVESGAKEALGEFSLDTSGGGKGKLYKVGKGLYLKIAAKNRMPRAKLRNKSLVRKFKKAFDKSGHANGQIKKLVILDKSWNKKYDPITNRLVSRSMRVAVGVKHKHGLCSFFYGGIDEEFNERGKSQGLSAGIYVDGKGGPIRCNKI